MQPALLSLPGGPAVRVCEVTWWHTATPQAKNEQPVDSTFYGPPIHCIFRPYTTVTSRKSRGSVHQPDNKSLGLCLVRSVTKDQLWYRQHTDTWSIGFLHTLWVQFFSRAFHYSFGVRVPTSLSTFQSSSLYSLFSKIIKLYIPLPKLLYDFCLLVDPKVKGKGIWTN